MLNGFRFNLLQKQHDLSIFQFLFAKLSLVRITPLLKNQRKILPSNVSLTSKLFVKLLTHYWQGICTFSLLWMNKPIFYNFHTKTSLPCCKIILAILVTRWSHSSSLFPTKALLNSTLRVTELNTSATFACFLWTMLNKVGYWVSSGRFPNKYPFTVL